MYTHYRLCIVNKALVSHKMYVPPLHCVWHHSGTGENPQTQPQKNLKKKKKKLKKKYLGDFVKERGVVDELVELLWSLMTT